MKKEYKVLVLSFVFVFMFSSLAHAMSWGQFIETYPNEYIYRVDFPTGTQNYFSSPCELEFRIYDTGTREVFRVYKKVPDSSSVRRLRGDGMVGSFSGDYLEFTGDINDYVGADIWRWTGNGFFLPELSTILGSLGGLIRTILPVGFGIVSVMLLVKLLAVYWKRFVHRSL